MLNHLAQYYSSPYVIVIIIIGTTDVWHLLCGSLRVEGNIIIAIMHPSVRNITILDSVGIATMDTHRTLEKQAHLTRNRHTKLLSKSSSQTSIKFLIVS